jgi:hypothetical protein
MAYGTPILPQVYTFTVTAGDTFEDTVINFPGIAVFLQLSNEGSDSLDVRLNSLTTYFTLQAGHTQVFNYNDCHLTSVAFRNVNISGGGSDVYMEVLAGVVAS